MWERERGKKRRDFSQSRSRSVSKGLYFMFSLNLRQDDTFSAKWLASTSTTPPY
jgi:hypothetical protein